MVNYTSGFLIQTVIPAVVKYTNVQVHVCTDWQLYCLHNQATPLLASELLLRQCWETWMKSRQRNENASEEDAP